MNEYFIPTNEDLPQQEMVANWVKDSNQRFNQALSTLSTEWGGDQGFETIGGKRVLTGEGWCDDAAVAYGKALSEKFPFIKNLNLNILNFPKGLTHSILSFSVGKGSYFLDPTHGQINKVENTVLLDRLEMLPQYYSLEKGTYSDIEELVYDYKQDGISYEVVNNSVIVTDFKSSYGVHTINNIATVNGHQITPNQYLLNALMQQPYE